MADAKTITHALGGQWRGSYGTAPCPAHDDAWPSLSLADGANGRLLARCHAVCGWPAVLGALRAQGLAPAHGGGATAATPQGTQEDTA